MTIHRPTIRRRAAHRRAVLRRVAAAVLATLALTSCATIPEHTQPRVVGDREVAPGVNNEPEKGLDSIGVVRKFIERSGDLDAAKAYLAPEVRAAWPKEKTVTIVDDSIQVLPPAQEDPAKATTERTVVLTMKSIGRLDQTQSYYPSSSASTQLKVKVKQQPDGQWRISEPLDYVLLRETEFVTSFQRVDLQFFDPALRLLVPDPRYVVRAPTDGLPRRALDLLLAGPSPSLAGAVRTLFPDEAKLYTNPKKQADGSLFVSFAGLGAQSEEDRIRIAAQVVMTLAMIDSSPLQLRSDDQELLLDHGNWDKGDVKGFTDEGNINSELLGMVAAGGRLYSMRDGKPIEGPAGNGTYPVVSGAQSLDGGQLAIVTTTGAGMRLRVGETRDELAEVDLAPAARLTRPTWLLSSAKGKPSNEVWTVQDESLVVRAVRPVAGSWSAAPVDSAALNPNGGKITELRLSRDGVRVAAIVDGRVVIGSLVRDPATDSVAITQVRTVHENTVTQAVGLDWYATDIVIVATKDPAIPVISIPIEGAKYTLFTSTNLTMPMTAVTKVPGRSTVVVDGSGMSTTGEPSAAWRRHDADKGPRVVPFYPG